jgi:hypothetical protein
MYSELQLNPGWTDLDIFKITYDEYMAFSRRYMAGQVASNPLSTAPNSNASSTDLFALFTKSIVESKEMLHPRESSTRILVVTMQSQPKASRRLLPFCQDYLQFQLLFSQVKEILIGVLNIIGDAAQ